MASSIDPTVPVQGNPTTLSVRDNFLAAKNEIEALQAEDVTIKAYTVTAGSGITGGGTISTSPTLNVGAGTGITVNANDVAFNTTWGDARYLQGNQTITLSGDATGSGTTSIAVTVANDSHSHTGATISGLAASDTTSGTFDDARIPNLNASKTTAGTFADARIPSLATSKITSGTFADARISQSSVTQHQSAINAGKVDGKSISVVASLPGTPDANTIYFITG